MSSPCLLPSPSNKKHTNSAKLSTDDKEVGTAHWSGIVVSHDLCGHCKEYKVKTEHIVKVNYQVTL